MIRRLLPLLRPSVALNRHSPNGNWVQMRQTYRLSQPHHTSIVPIAPVRADLPFGERGQRPPARLQTWNEIPMSEGSEFQPQGMPLMALPQALDSGRRLVVVTHIVGIRVQVQVDRLNDIPYPTNHAVGFRGL